MSLKGFPEYDHRVRRMSTQRMNDSGELDVFEATRYFSSCNDVVGYNGGFLSQKAAVREERFASGGRRMSLDMPTIGSIPSQSHRVDNILKEKRNKVPSSPGGKVASFLNSLFNQAASKKKKSKSSSLSMKDEEESPSGRRKRRSSISIFPSIKTHDLKSTATSGFRTPPSCIDTPTKGYKDVRSYTDHKVKPVASQGEVPIAKKEDMDLTWLDEKFKLIDNLSKEKNISEKDRIWVDKFSSAKGDSKKDYGYESDSSSDLFELNYEVGSVYSSDLPVYRTTNMENIKRGPPICNGVM